MYYVLKAVFYLLHYICVVLLLITSPFLLLFDKVDTLSGKIRLYAINKYKDKYNEEVSKKQ